MSSRSHGIDLAPRAREDLEDILLESLGAWGGRANARL
jgi:hypothetical protein